MQLFKKYLSEVIENEDEYEDITNVLYAPDLIGHLVLQYLSLFPLFRYKLRNISIAMNVHIEVCLLCIRLLSGHSKL